MKQCNLLDTIYNEQCYYSNAMYGDMMMFEDSCKTFKDFFLYNYII